MRIVSIVDNGIEHPGLVDPQRGVVVIEDLVSSPIPDAMVLLSEFARFSALADGAPDDVFRPYDSVSFGPPYRRPRKIWGIGLNYVEHAGDLSAEIPVEPASFIKGDHTIIGPDDAIILPTQSSRVTAEAELGLVIGQFCRNVEESEALDYVWGLCCILDQTAEDILQRNPRFLTRSKNFPTFFSFGPEIVPFREVVPYGSQIGDLKVSTVKNGVVERSNLVGNMIFSPATLVSFHSKVMPLFPGDIISTGTPGAVVIEEGDVVECRIEGLPTLRNRVELGSTHAAQ